VKKICFNIITLLIFGMSLLSAQNSVSQVNMVATIASLEKTIELYASGEYGAAKFQAELGQGYASNVADFPYLIALCAYLLDESAEHCLHALLPAFEDGMQWHRYSKMDANLLSARLNLHLKNYRESLHMVTSLPFEMSDAELIKASSLYGLNRRGEAEAVIDQALDRHSFDSRFPKLFFIQEKDRRRTEYSRKVAKRILENLYVWKDSDPILLALSVHFEKDDKINRRNLKIYREMHTHFLPSYTPNELFLVGETILSNINFGILSDEASIKELFSLKVELRDHETGKKTVMNAVYREHLLQLSKLIGNNEAREVIKGILSNYSALVIEDENHDGILESVLYYKSGRPDVALFDPDQYGYPHLIVECNFGIPKTVRIEDSATLVSYDEYPYVSSVKMKDEFFQMLPRVFKWQPFTLERLKLMLFSDVEKHKSFFVLKINSHLNDLSPSSLTKVAAYKESELEDEVERVFYDKGEIISREKRVSGTVILLVNYKNGRPSVGKCDVDGDGYFEKKEEYDDEGHLHKISLDFNKDGVFEYNETYDANGSIKKEWDDGGLHSGKSINRITYTSFSQDASVIEWVHPVSGQLVRLNYIEKEPSSVDVGKTNFPIFKDVEGSIYWFKKIPDNSAKIAMTATKAIEEKMAKEASPLFSCIVEMQGGTVFAVKSGGLIFAEYVSD